MLQPLEHEGSLVTITHSSHWGAFEAEVEAGRLVSVKPFSTDADPSPILDALPGMVHSSMRVARPMIRKGWLENGAGPAEGARGRDSFVAMPWDEALDMVAGEIRRIRDSQGNEALFSGSYGWASAGRFHHAKTQLQRFFNLIGGSTTQIGSYSYAAGQTLLPHIVGSMDPLVGPLSSWDGIVADTRILVAFGGIPLKNAQVEAGGTAEHTTGPWLERARRAGIRIVNISPIRDDIGSKFGAEWISIRPGTDTAMLLAMAYVLQSEGRHDRAFLDTYCVGFDQFAEYLRGSVDGIAKTPEWAASLTGVPAETIANLARAMAGERSMINLAWSLQRADKGEQPYWAAISLACLIGQIGLPGGGFGFGYGTEAGMGNPRRPIPLPTHQAGQNPCPSAIPVARIADMLLAPGTPYEFDGGRYLYPDTRLIYWCGGNPFHHHQDLNRLVQAFQMPDTIIVNECWWTATAKHADIVLPATTTLERNDIGASKRDRHLIAMKQAIAPVGEARSDFAIFSALAARFDLKNAFTEERNERAWLEKLYEDAQVGARGHVELPPFDVFWRDAVVAVPGPDEPYTLFSAFRSEPERHPLDTPSGKIEIFSERIASFDYDDCPGNAVWLEPEEWLGADAARTYPLHLISNQPKTRLHSQMDAAGPSLASKIKGREPISINPADAEERGLEAGDICRVFNARGALLAGVVIDSGVMQGVVQLSTGAWFDPDVDLELERHGNPNVLTDDRGASRLAQGPIAQSCLVQLEKWSEPLPVVKAFTQPRYRRMEGIQIGDIKR
ncbi:molybdopterin guanine dinucleotide-containing S/N-oxide reductase [Agrobacterium sp. 22-222-1]